MKELFADAAIDIINELHTERLDYYSEYLPLINAALALKDYEEKEISAVNDLKSLEENSLCSICQHFGESDMDLYCASCNGTPYVVTDCFEWRGKDDV